MIYLKKLNWNSFSSNSSIISRIVLFRNYYTSVCVVLRTSRVEFCHNFIESSKNLYKNTLYTITKLALKDFQICKTSMI